MSSKWKERRDKREKKKRTDKEEKAKGIKDQLNSF